MGTIDDGVERCPKEEERARERPYKDCSRETWRSGGGGL